MNRDHVMSTESRFWKLIGPGLALLLSSGCASYGVIVNDSLPAPKPGQEYSVRSHDDTGKSSDISLMLTFSGGGTRAAALAYGVMQELRDTNVMVNGKSTRLLDEVDTISSVSGGSFTAAYYGLHGDGLFETFEDTFLRYDIQGQLVKSVLNPFHWFGRKGRTQRSIEYYQKKIFHDATYADMLKPGRPLIVINASDLAYGVRFSFIQEYFDLLCSDLLSYPVANAVTASSAVPVVFNPVVVENYPDCGGVDISWLAAMRDRAEHMRNMELSTLSEQLESYSNKSQRKFIHFVDGGITDNMGLRAMYDVVMASGGPEMFLDETEVRRPEKIIVIAIDASTEPVDEMDVTNKEPSIAHAIGALSGVQLHRYNVATLELIESSFYDWADKISTPDQTVHPYFIELSFEDLKHPKVRAFFNKVPTSFSLTDEQVDRLIAAGRQILREHPGFQRLLADLNQS